MTKTFCPIPWLFQAPRANGDIRICCQANNSPTAGIVRKDDGTPYNANTDNLAEARNANLMKIVRKNMLDGVWSDECIRCRTEEDNNEYSRRKYELDNWDYTVYNAIKETESDGTIDTDVTPINYYDFRFGNKCNLACRMCGPTDSDFWYDDWIKLRGTNEFHDNGGDTIVIGRDNPYDWHSNENFWAQVEINISNIKHIYFAGGEPLLIQRHYAFLEKCVAEGHAQEIVIEYNTNMTTLPPRVTELWSHFKEVRVGMSIDGIEDVFEYQRYPAKWDKVQKNILKLSNLSGNIRSWFAYTVSIYNVEHITDFIDWYIEQDFDDVDLKHHMVYGPEHVCVKALPIGYKNLVKSKLDDFRKNKYIHNKKICGMLESIVDFMFADDYNIEYGEYLREYTLKLDKIRNQSINDVVPNLAEHIRGES